jgi:hypothetical protein
LDAFLLCVEFGVDVFNVAVNRADHFNRRRTARGEFCG